ncbi:MAG TPA: T9SS type A sorting domain-containing protein, partial [Bacteroidia bacterium]|nr:T9SS type A sorting domain-containing protein [Bacteroidia bacterium]
TVSCNTVIGRYPAVNYQNKGIYGSMNQKCYISCNITDSLYKGVHFSSSNIATKFRGNEMKKHYIGLYLDNTAVIDTQSHAGNMWTGTYNSTYGAWNENDSLTSQLFASLFIVDPVLGAFYNPNIPLGINPGEPNDQGWFDQIVGGNTYSCTGSLLCADKPIERSQGSGNLKEAIASGDVLTTDYIDESKSTAKLFLFEDLKKDSLLFSNNPVLMQFLSNNATSVFGKLNNTKQLMQESFTIDSLYILQINEKDSLLKIHLNNVKTLDSLAAADSTIENLTVRENEIDIIANIQQDINNILSITIANKVAKLNDATTWNNAVQPNEIPEYNLKQVNDINIIYEQTNSNDSIIQFYGTLLNIAEQCPQSGGMAVYVARSLVALFGDTIFYNDENVCFQQGYYRIANETKSNKTEKEVDLKPNPANNYADVILNKSFEGICRIKITDMYSKIIFEQSFDCHEKQFRINTTDVLNGMYNVQITINDNTQAIVKLIIVK